MNWSTGSSNIREVFLAVSDTSDAVDTKVSGVPGRTVRIVAGGGVVLLGGSGHR